MKRCKNFGLFLAVLFTSMSYLYSQVDYINSGYYQFVYKADMAYLQKHYDSALHYYGLAEQAAPLLNQLMYCEQERYGYLLIKNKNIDKGIEVLSDAIKKNRTTIYIVIRSITEEFNLDTTEFCNNPKWNQLWNIKPNPLDVQKIEILKKIYENDYEYEKLIGKVGSILYFSKQDIFFTDSLFFLNP